MTESLFTRSSISALLQRPAHWYLALLLLFMLAAVPRVIDLDRFISPDEPRWQQNTIGFHEGLTTFDFKKLYQQPHPGITTMWLAAPVAHTTSWATLRLPAAVAVSLLIVYVADVTARLWGREWGVLAGVLLALNPHFIAHSRVLAMDAHLSIFLLLSVLTLLLWGEQRFQKYLVISGVTAALALLSKLSGIVAVALFGLFLLWLLVTRQQTVNQALKTAAWWFSSFLLALVIVLPTIITDWSVVYSGTREFFLTDHYGSTVHALGAAWYPEALLLWSTPLELLGVLGVVLALVLAPAKYRRQLLVLLVFFGLFFAAVQYSVKKGDRYLLPNFLVWDVMIVAVAAGLWQWGTQLPVTSAKIVRLSLITIMSISLLWQAVHVSQLHPYALAYRNPLFRDIAHMRTMGWGEGLDLAAEYLNQKPNAENILVIAYYEGQFGYRFKGQVTSAERLAKESAVAIGGQYVVLYRTMQGRAPDRWETKVLQEYSRYTPEHVITLNQEEYVWIYNVAQQPSQPAF